MISWLIEKLIQKNDIERYSKQNFNNEYSNLFARIAWNTVFLSFRTLCSRLRKNDREVGLIYELH